MINRHFISYGSARQRGFTLLELLITMAVLSIALAMAIPNLNTGRAHTLSQAKAFKAALNFARSEAVNLSRPVVMCSSQKANVSPSDCSGTWKDGWIVYLDSNGDGAPSAGEVLRRRQPLAGGVTVQTALATARITFDRSGFTTNDGEFLFCSPADKSEGRKVVLAASGRSMKVSGVSTCS